MTEVRIGVVGVGNMGKEHLKYMPEVRGAKLTAVCDVDAARAKDVAGQHGAAAFTDYKEMIASGKIDAVLIATLHYFHPPVAMAAFERGIHVLCEKPLSVTIGAGREVVAAQRAHPGVKFGMMLNQRSNPMYRTMREIVQGGQLGELTRVSWIITEWFRTWAYYASGGWRATWRGEGGGVLTNQCPHNLDLLQWITGQMPSRITAIASLGKTHPIEVEDEVSAILEYKSGAIGHFVTTTGEAPGSNRLEICGDHGKIVADRDSLTFHRIEGSVREIREKSTSTFASAKSTVEDVPYEKSNQSQHMVMTQNFVDAILKGDALIAPGEDGLASVELSNAMLMAGVTRKPVDLPLDAAAYEKFLQEMIAQADAKKKKAGGA